MSSSNRLSETVRPDNFVEPVTLTSPWHTLAQRIVTLALVLGIEAVLASVWLDGSTLTGKSGFLTAVLRGYGSWMVKGVIGFAALFTTFAWLRYKPGLVSISRNLQQTSIRPLLFLAHFAALSSCAAFSTMLYGNFPSPLPPGSIAGLWLITAAAATAFAALAVAPAAFWSALFQTTRKLWIFTSAASILACIAGEMSWRLWQPASQLTYALVELLLRPFISDLVMQPAKMLIGTRRFDVIISPECSGLEGTALMLIFSIIWLVLFREEIRFPQALALVPAGVIFLFLLNSVRIAVLVMIGTMGAREVAAKGFHSQAGWIAFNSVAFTFSVIARRVPWFSVRSRDSESSEAVEYTAAPWLVPLLAILAAGMLSRSMTSTFEWMYPLRLTAALCAFWFLRRRYTDVDWKFGWTGPAIGVLVFILWIALDRLSHASAHDAMPAAMPPALAQASPGLRNFWIVARILAATITVPLAEELAFRGFLLRRLVSAEFETVSFGNYTPIAIAVSSLAFGLLHGERWLAGTAAGALYAFASLRKRRLGEAVAAHATTNALLAAYVLTSGNWSFW